MADAGISDEGLETLESERAQRELIIRTLPGGEQNIEEMYPLTPLQEGMLFHSLLSGGSDTYILPALLELQSHITPDMLCEALQKVVARNAALRCCIVWDQGGRPFQVVNRRVQVPVEHIQLNPARDRIAQLGDLLKPGRQTPFALGRAPLLRLLMAEPENGVWHAILQLHHLIVDVSSMRLLLSEVMAYLDGQGGALGPPESYGEYVAEVQARSRANDANDFFRNELHDIFDVTAPFGVTDAHGSGERLQEVTKHLSPSLASDIRVQCIRLGIRPARFFHAAWALVVAATSGRDDVVYGTVLSISRYTSSRSNTVMGLSVNTLPIRLRLDRITAKQLLEATDASLCQLLKHVYTPLSVAQQCSGVPNGSPLFTSILNYRHTKHETNWSSPSGVRVVVRGEACTNYPIAISVDERDSSYHVTAQVDRRIDSARLLSHFETACAGLAAALEREDGALCRDISVIPEGEALEIKSFSRGTSIELPTNPSVHALFSDQARRTPQRVAVLLGDQSITFEELDCRSSRLAKALEGRGLRQEPIVGVLLGRGLEQIVAILGVLKAGGAFLPLDPRNPVDRLTHIIRDAAPELLITDRKSHESLMGSIPEKLLIDEVLGDVDDAAEWQGDFAPARAASLAYIIYTSGSTGRPKGVMISHRSVVNHWTGLDQIYGAYEGCPRVAMNASLTFDASIQQLVQLLSGRTLLLIADEVRRDAEKLVRLLRSQQICGVDCTPSQLAAWESAGLLSGSGHSLKVVLVGGEAIDSGLWSRLEMSKDIQFYNVYGPTECTVDSTCRRILEGRPSIGGPLPNISTYVLDRNGRPVPIGVAGELFIGGNSVARGYWRQPGLTAERFLPDPFSERTGSLMYRTGDIGKWRKDGGIEYCGRNDFQIKIRGFRVEPGEIEEQILDCPGVRSAVVIAAESGFGMTRLVAYVVLRDPHSDVQDFSSAIREQLSAALPDYMVPTVIVALPKLPMTPNGKVDRAALPPVDDSKSDESYEPPREGLEETIAGIWGEVLRRERVGRSDHFFDLGGDSLTAMQVTARIRSITSADLSVSALFNSPILRDLSSHIEHCSG